MGEVLKLKLGDARFRAGLTQQEVSAAVGIHQGELSLMEQGKRLPSVPQLVNLARVLGVSLQYLLTGFNRPGVLGVADLALQLAELGIADLHFEKAPVPGAFLNDEEAIALALAGNAPDARIVEAMPAVLAWNKTRPDLLRAFAKTHDGRIENRIAWLSDIALTIHRTRGFPGGFSHVADLEKYVNETEKPKTDDSLGFAAENHPRPLVTLRWRIGYPAPLNMFQARAERLAELREAEFGRFLRRK